jgi:hypothetical protein
MAYHSEDFVRAVESFYPGQIAGNVDFVAVNDGTGPVIAQWHRADLREPTQAEIEAVDTDALPPPAPEPPPPEVVDVVAFDHENRLRALEGVPPLSLDDFRRMSHGGV